MSTSSLVFPDNNENLTYVPLHCHTEHSVLDGLSKPSELAHRAKELGMPACAITDHGAMSGCVEFYQACLKEGIKPILGMEAYMTPYGHSLTERMPYDVKELRNTPGKGHQRNNYHAILLAKSYKGMCNLAALHTLSYAQGYYYKPRIDFEVLEKYHEDIIFQNACILGEVNHHLLHEDMQMARDHALRLQELFGEDYYFEIMNHGLDMEIKVMPMIRELAKELGIKVVATNDSHFTYGPSYGLRGDGSGDPALDERRRKDSRLQRTMMLLGMHKSWADPDVAGSFFDEEIPSGRQQKLKDDESGDSSDPIFAMDPSLYVKSYDEMIEALCLTPEDHEYAVQELANTLEVAAKCNCELPIIDPNDMSQYHTPLYAIEKDIQYNEYKGSGFELREETIKSVVDAMNAAGKEGSSLDEVLNTHEHRSLHFLMWMCEKGIEERIRPKIEAKGEPLPVEFYMENPPVGFEVVHKHNSPDESWIKAQFAEGKSVEDIIEIYRQRLDYEVSIVCRKGFLDYFSIVQQYCNYARFNGSQVGPGRGCLAPETLILLPGGQVKTLDNIQVGDVVYDEKGSAARVERVYRYDVSEVMRDLTVFNSGHIKLTSDHKVLAVPAQRTNEYDEYVVNGKYVQYKDSSPEGEPNWIEARNLHKGDWIFLPKPSRTIREPKRYDLADYIPEQIRTRVEIFDDHLEHKVYPREKTTLSARDVHRISGVSRNAIKSFLKDGTKTTCKTIKRLDDALQPYGLTAKEWKENWTSWDHIDVIPRYIEVNEDFCQFLGYFVADGNAHRGDISLYFHLDDAEYIEEYSHIVKRIFGMEMKSEIPNKEKKLKQGIITSSILTNFMQQIIPWKTHSKQLPDEFMCLSDSLTKALIKGLIDGDGSIKDEGRASFTSTCRDSIYKVRYLAASLGMLGCVIKREYPAETNYHDSWTIRFTTCPLLEELYGIVDKKSSTGHTYVDCKQYFAMRIKENREYYYQGEVYDLQVNTPNEPSYVTEAGIVHNSGAGALLNYLLGITSVDPLPNKLIFERFLNPDRVGYPDIDVDFDKKFRDEQLKPYLRQEYGEDSAAGVSTFIYAWGKAALRAASRVLFNPPESVQWADELCNLIDDHPKLDLNSELQDGVNPALVSKINSGKQYKQILELALMLQGRITGTSIHASAFILSPHPITDKMPLTVPKAERERVQKTGEKTVDYLIAYDGDVTQTALGYVKLDLLCIKDLEVLTSTIETIERVYGCKINIENIPMDDEAVFQMLYDHNVAGIFQLDGSSGMAQVMDDVKPQSIEEINAVVALFRPGPMDYIPTYVKGKWHPETVKYLDPRLEPILKDTYGVMAYQEEAMQVTQVIGGFSGGQADHYRKCISKDSLIWTESGPYTIAELYALKKTSETPLKFHTFDESQCATKFNGVRYIISKGKKRVVKVTLKDGSSIVCTPDHKILTETGWEKASKLVGHYVYKDIAEKYGTLSEDASKILITAAMVAEGYMPGKHQTWYFCNKDEREIEAFVEAYKAAFSVDPNICPPDDKGVRRVMVYPQHIASLGIRCGKSDEKILPSWVLRLNKRGRDYLLGKMIDFDGYCSHAIHDSDSSKYVIGYSSKNRALCEQILMIFNDMGVKGKIYSKYNNDYDQYYYSVEVACSRDVQIIARCLEGHSFKIRELSSLLDKEDEEFFRDHNTATAYVIPNDYWYPKIQFLIQNSGYSARELFGNNPPRIDNADNASVAVIQRFLKTAGRNKQLEKLADSNREVYFEEVVAVEDAGTEDVYDFTMNTGCLPQAFANGILVHNCAAKKHMEDLILIRDDFIDGALANNTDPEVAEELWEMLVKFGAYAFNRSHSAAYAYIAYRGGFLKAHFPECFLAAMCTIKPMMKKTDKVPSYMEEARQMGVTVKPPHVNYSMENFDVPTKGVIAFGLGGIKRVGQGAAPIIAEREKNGPFKDFTDFCTRVPKQVGKAPIEALIKAGALDGLGWSRMAMEESIEQIIDFRKSYFSEKEKKELFSDDLFGDLDDDGGTAGDNIRLIAPFDTEYSEMELMYKEKEQFGMYFGRDPRDFSRVSRYMLETRLERETRDARRAGDYNHPVFINIKQVPDFEDGTRVEFIANVSDVRSFNTKKGSRMAFVTVWDNGIAEESRYGFAPTKTSIKCTVFARTWENMTPPLTDDVVRIQGRINVDKTGRYPTSIVVDSLETIPPDADWMSASTSIEKTMEYANARAEMEARDAELADPSSKRYLIPALEFKDTTDLDAFLLDPDLDTYRGNGWVQVSAKDDEGAARTELLHLKQTRGMVAFASRYGAVAKKIRLPKAQRAMERRAMMSARADDEPDAVLNGIV